MSNALVIGNKPYENLSLDDILDSFEENYRCNMSLPNRNNGTKYDNLGLCIHLYEALVGKKLSKQAFIEKYKKIYKLEEIETFYDLWVNDSKKFKNIFFSKPNTNAYNDYLSKNESLLTFSKEPRTGYRAVFDNLIKGKNVYITNFSIDNEVRKTYYVKENLYESKFHSKTEEVNIIKWLHKNDKVDASLCLLEDVEVPTFNCEELMPTKLIIDKVLSFNKCCFLKHFQINDEFKNNFSSYKLGLREGIVYIENNE